MVTWLVDGRDQQVDPADRGLAYGDGLFETMAARDGRIAHLDRHLSRLETGCERLGFAAPPRRLLEFELDEILPADGRWLVKLIVTRGPGARGYAPPVSPSPTRIVGLMPWPDRPIAHYTHGIGLVTLTFRLATNPALAGLKHLNRLEQVLARTELAKHDAEEGLLLDNRDFVIGGTSSNLFFVTGTTLTTPNLDRCGVAGIMRALVLDHADLAHLDVSIRDVKLSELEAADEIFVTNAVIGIWPVRRLDGKLFEPGSATRRLQALLGYPHA